MDTESTNIMSSDIFLATKFVEKLKAKYIDVAEDTLLLGMYGYLSVIFANLIQNTATMVSEYSMEAIPTRAKFEKNVISHALAVGINQVNATPASISVLLAFPEEYLVRNMDDTNTLILDKDFVFSVGDRQLYPYLLDYNIEIKRNILLTGKIVYTAKYQLDNRNPLSIHNNPYLPSLGVINAEGQDMVALQTTLRQMTHNVIHYKLITNNPLETKTKEFTFEDQLAFFYVEVFEETDEGIVSHYLEPIYEGLHNYEDNKEYISYMYLDEKTIRLKFDRDSYQPRRNAEVDIHVYTTLGSACNIYLDDSFQIYREMTSTTYNYSGLYTMIRSNSSSLYGEDRASVEKLQKLIPKEMLSRGSYSTYSDLNTFFNILQTEDCRIDVFQRVFNQLENIYSVYLLMKYNGYVVPSNTINLSINRDGFTHTARDNFILKPNSTFYLPKGSSDAVLASDDLSDEEITELEKDGFVYTCPFLMVVNKYPFYVSFYNIYLKYDRVLYFDFINDNSDLQFIAEKFKVYRNVFDSNKDEFHMQVQCMQNINSNYNIIVLDEKQEIIDINIKTFAVFYTTDPDGNSKPIRYLEGELIDYNSSALVYTFDFKMTTNDVIAGSTPSILFTSGPKTIRTGKDSPVYFENNIQMKLFIFIKSDKEYGREYGEKLELTTDSLIPNMKEWSLTNIYTTNENGVDIFYDYSDLMTSYIKQIKTDTDLHYWIGKIPVLKKSWWNNEDKVTYFLQMLDYRRRYIQQSLELIENPFGINMKLYNTYGPSVNYSLNNKETIDRINLTLNFEIMFTNREDQAILSNIQDTIKAYIEDLNDKSDLHIPNLITYITNLYQDSIKYIKFIGLNDYADLYQSIYKSSELNNDSWKESQNIPEFININILPNGLPDINFDIVEL